MNKYIGELTGNAPEIITQTNAAQFSIPSVVLKKDSTQPINAYQIKSSANTLTISGGIYGERYALYKFMKENLGFLLDNQSMTDVALNDVLFNTSYDEAGIFKHSFSYDLHTHTKYSLDSTEEVSNYTSYSKQLGLSTIGFSDHYYDTYWDPTVCDVQLPSNGMKKTDFPLLKADVSNADKTGLNVLVGLETDILPDGTLCVNEDTIKDLDYLIVSDTHYTQFSHITDSDQTIADFMIAQFKRIVNDEYKDYITTIGHPFSPNVFNSVRAEGIVKLITDAQYRECFKMAVDAGIAIEINPLIFYHDNLNMNLIKDSDYMRMWKIAKEEGCKFTIGSDAHGTSEYYYHSLIYADMIMDICGITEDDLLNLNAETNAIYDNGKVSVNWDCPLSNNLEIFVASYNSDGLLDVSTYSYDKSSSSRAYSMEVTPPSGATSVKVFSWDSINTISPVGNVTYVSIQ